MSNDVESIATPIQRKVSFLDLAPETRSQIYHHLFRGQKVVIRKKDAIGKEERARGKYSRRQIARGKITRDRAMGLNILFVCKAVLAEAKPVLLTDATFDLDFDSLISRAYSTTPTPTPTWRKHQGFTQADLALVRSLEIHDIPRSVHLTNQICDGILGMPNLRYLALINHNILRMRYPADDTRTQLNAAGYLQNLATEDMLKGDKAHLFITQLRESAWAVAGDELQFTYDQTFFWWEEGPEDENSSYLVSLAARHRITDIEKTD